MGYVKDLLLGSSSSIEKNKMEDSMGAKMQTALEEELQSPSSLLEKGIKNTTSVISRLVADEAQLEREIAERQEILRQTRISIKAFSSAKQELESGLNP